MSLSPSNSGSKGGKVQKGQNSKGKAEAVVSYHEEKERTIPAPINPHSFRTSNAVEAVQIAEGLC